MQAKRDFIELQSKRHGLVSMERFKTIEEYFLYLIHLKAYEEAAKLAKDKIVLDYGCNNGYGTSVISPCCKEVIGLDVSSKAIKQAKKICESENTHFNICNGTDIPFESKKFDLVVSFQVIEHISDPKKYLSEIKRVLSKNGVAIFTTPNAQVRLDPGMRPWHPFHAREYTADELKNLLIEQFARVHIQGLFGKEPIHSTELNRLKRARLTARKRARWVNAISAKLRVVLPEPIKNFIRTSLDRIRDQHHKLNPQVLQEYSTKDLSYYDNELDKALDLMAICSDED